jgi:hypothetical protein
MSTHDLAGGIAFAVSVCLSASFQRLTIQTAGSPPAALALTRRPPGTISNLKVQPCSSPVTAQPPGATFHRLSAIQASRPPNPPQSRSR